MSLQRVILLVRVRRDSRGFVRISARSVDAPSCASSFTRPRSRVLVCAPSFARVRDALGAGGYFPARRWGIFMRVDRYTRASHPRRPTVAIDTRPNLAVTIHPLSLGDEPMSVREALAAIAALGYRGAQLNAADPATRPRDLGPSARRDLAATLARHELACAGIDLFIPPSHFSDPAQQSRAFDAVISAIGLGADLDRAPITLPLPDDLASGLRQAIASEAERLGVHILIAPKLETAKVGVNTGAGTGLGSTAAVSSSATPTPAQTLERPIEPPFAAFVDCAAVLAAQLSPEALVSSLGDRLGAVRVVDLLRSGLRGPILEPRESRLDALSLRLSIDLSPASRSGRPIAIVDARQWVDVRGGIERSILRWRALLD